MTGGESFYLLRRSLDSRPLDWKVLGADGKLHYGHAIKIIGSMDRPNGALYSRLNHVTCADYI